LLHKYVIVIPTVDTASLIKKRIMQNYTALTVNENEPISLLPDSDIVNSIKTDAPDLKIQWSLNGIFLQDEEDRLEIKNDYEIGNT